MPRHDFVCANDKCDHAEIGVVLVGVEESKWEVPHHCGEPMEINWATLNVPAHVFEAYDTRNIHPDGRKIHIGSKGDLAHVAREYGVRTDWQDPDLVAEGGQIVKRGSWKPGAFVDMGSRR